MKRTSPFKKWAAVLTIVIVYVSAISVAIENTSIFDSFLPVVNGSVENVDEDEPSSLIDDDSDSKIAEQYGEKIWWKAEISNYESFFGEVNSNPAYQGQTIIEMPVDVITTLTKIVSSTIVEATSLQISKDTTTTKDKTDKTETTTTTTKAEVVTTPPKVEEEPPATTTEKVEVVVPPEMFDIDNIENWLTITDYHDEVYVKSLKIQGEEKSKTISGRDLRAMLGLRSTHFDIKSTSKGFTITTYGYGHGVGMSQYGAYYYATKSGWAYDKILSHFYTGTKIVNVDKYEDQSLKVNNKDINVYDAVCRVVQNEVGSFSKSPDTLKAQAIAAYTFIKYSNDTGGNASIGMSSQSSVSSAVKKAVKEVSGKMITNSSGKKAIYTPFFSGTGGRTASCGNVYSQNLSHLVSVKSEYETGNGISVTFTAKEMRKILEELL